MALSGGFWTMSPRSSLTSQIGQHRTVKAIILARVSTKEQEEGHSIAAQRQRLIDYCARKDLQVLKTFELVESSTRGERKEFAAMLEFAQAQNETVAIVADAVDRFQRSFKESVLIDELIHKGKVELHFYRENMVIGTGASSTDILRWDFSVMGAKSYVLNLSENVRRSLEYKRRNGEWGGKAPLGYLNQRDANNKSTLIHDPERAFLVRMLFEEYAKGFFSISGDLVRMAREWGLRNKTRKGGVLSASQIQHILMNPFYYGEMRNQRKAVPAQLLPARQQRAVQPVRTGSAWWFARDHDAVFGEAVRVQGIDQMRDLKSHGNLRSQ